MDITHLQKTHLQNLLTHTHLIVDRHEDTARITGANFNLFDILGVGQLEVSTHSAILCDLLNPSGSHGQGDVFLRSFLRLESVLTAGIDPKTTQVFKESHIGKVTEISGGRIDILLKDGKGNQIAIENKIYAADQKNWVRRYLQYLGYTPEDFATADDQDRDEKISPLYYLTLFGTQPVTDDPDEKSAVNCLSYHSDIIEWLEECRKEAVETPLVRESITQYINLLHTLTGQNPNQKMNQEIVNLALKDAENFEAAKLVIESGESIMVGLIDNLKAQLKKHCADKLEIVDFPFIPSKRYQGICFSHPKITSSKIHPRGLHITIQFRDPNFNGCNFGFSFIEQNHNFKNPSPFEIALNKNFRENFEPDTAISDWWIGNALWQEFKDWDQQVFNEILSKEETFAKKIMKLVESLVEIIPDQTEIEQLNQSQP